MHFRVNIDLVEQGQLPKWPKQLAAENSLEVYGLLRLIIELHPQRIGGSDSEGFNVINMMCGWHSISRARWAAASRRPGACSNLPVAGDYAEKAAQFRHGRL